VADVVLDVLEQAILKGYRNAWLLPPAAATDIVEADERTAAHGLGASTPARERAVLRATVAQVRERLAACQITVPVVEHPEVGAL
jgi:hypothetical protein